MGSATLAAGAARVHAEDEQPLLAARVQRHEHVGA
eukprot:CAMPEP_0115366202 /NCGR_PEP_ID=MMETSP0270-20121206/104680_1 /TAXON_ID=71861 /ORGANISM="Scrippsiella trochoidea, Strain CCMP3099" /LENGTH=34 /DNA_ID= /DNA_START= /DNA_END= /DNA_ORIENTATION=